MASRPSISAGGIALAASGGLLVYAGLTKQSPLQALRGIAAGSPAPIPVAPSGQPYTPAGHSNPGNLGAGFPQLADAAQKYIGIPYVYGGSSPRGVDCSGLVQLSFRDLGVNDCPRTAEAQFLWHKLYPIQRGDVTKGDLIFWAAHVIIAVDNVNAVAAQHTGTNVKIIRIEDGHIGAPIGYCRYGTRPTHTQN